MRLRSIFNLQNTISALFLSGALTLALLPNPESPPPASDIKPAAVLSTPIIKPPVKPPVEATMSLPPIPAVEPPVAIEAVKPASSHRHYYPRRRPRFRSRFRLFPRF